MVACQWTRSLARVSGGASRPSRGAAYTRQVLLLGPDVVTLADDAQAEKIAIEGEAGSGRADADRGVIDAEEEAAAGLLLPARIALAAWKVDQLEGVTVGITEVEGRDAGGGAVRLRQHLRCARDRLHVRPYPRVRRVQVAHDDGDVLEPAVVALRVGGVGTSFRCREL